MSDIIRISLLFLNPDFVRNLRGQSWVAKKARALVMHDQALTGWPRG